MVGEAMQRMQRNEHLSASALAALQEQRLRELVRHAAAQSPFYAEHYRGINLERVTLSELPPVNKETIQANFDRVVTDRRIKLADVKEHCSSDQAGPWYLGAYCAMVTSGTTGKRGHYVWDGPALAEAIAVGFRQSNRAKPTGPPQPMRIAAIVQTDAHDASNVLLRMIPESVGTKRLIDIRQDFEAVCQQLQEFQPILLAAYPYMLRLLSEAQLDERHPLKIQPRRITSSADVLSQSDRVLIHKAFGVEPHNFYCSTEFPYLAWECDAHAGLHVNADTLVLESVDRANRPAPPGRLGDKVLVTNLANRVMPLIRYEMTDQVEYLAEPCPCGCPLPRLRTVAGREEHVLTLPGREGTPVRLIEEYVDGFIGPKEEVAMYQLIQEAPTRLTVNVVGRKPYSSAQVLAAVRSGLEQCFKRYGVDGTRLQIDLREVKRLEGIQPGSLKVCRFWNRCR
jgi:phenylacetate-coenzyme A ligase PaaK-like adenylate-forming protein